MRCYQGYIINHLMLKKWVDETYVGTFWKVWINDEIEKLEKEPLPDKK